MTAPKAASRDGFGQRVYRLPHPDTGEVHELWSVTRLLSLLAKPGLETWKQKGIATQLSQRPDLVTLAATDPYEACKQALDANRSAANMGTGIHALCDDVDAGMVDSVDQVPEPAKAHIGHYLEAKERFGWRTVEMERTVYSFAHATPYAGTFDRILDWPGLGLVISDTKTGKDVYPDVALQLVALATAEGMWNPSDERHQPLPEGLRTDVALVCHLTAKGCRFIPVELADAHKAWRAILAVRSFQTASPLGEPLVPDTDARTLGPTLDEQRADVRRMVLGLTAERRGELRSRWPADVPTKADECDADQLARIVALIKAVRAEHEDPFDDLDGGLGPNHPDVLAVRDRMQRLPSDLVLAVTNEATIDHDVPHPRSGRPWTREHLTIVEAALARQEDVLEHRLARIASLFSGNDWDDLVTNTIGADYMAWDAGDVEVAEALVAALDAGVARPSGNGLVFDEALLVAKVGSKSAVRDAGKALDPESSIRSAADVAADPILAGRVLAGAN